MSNPEALRFCSSCGQQNQPKAAFCQVCGAALVQAPQDQASDDSTQAPSQSSQRLGKIVAGVGLLVLIAVAALLLLRGGSAPGSSFEEPIEQALTQSLEAPVVVTCPTKVRTKKGSITDCEAVLPSGRQAQIFVTQVDGDGHFTYQPETAAIQAELQEKFARDAAASQAEIEREVAEETARIQREIAEQTAGSE